MSALLDPQARKVMATPGPYVAAMVAFLVAAPHLYWLFANDFLTFGYAAARALHFRGPLDYLIKPPKFLLSQLGFLVPSLLIAAPYLRRDVRAHSASKTRVNALMAREPGIHTPQQWLWIRVRDRRPRPGMTRGESVT